MIVQVNRKLIRRRTLQERTQAELDTINIINFWFSRKEGRRRSI